MGTCGYLYGYLSGTPQVPVLVGSGRLLCKYLYEYRFQYSGYRYLYRYLSFTCGIISIFLALNVHNI